MIFTSFNFLLFFGVLFSFYFLVPHKSRWIPLLAASLFFYGSFRLEYILFLVIPMIIIYFIGRKIPLCTSTSGKKLLLVLGIAAALIILLIYKYLDFFGSTIFSFLRLFNDHLKYSPLKLMLPVGISFYSFKMVSYLVDVYSDRLEAEKHPGYFALYVSFFPQLLAGPIDRAVNFIPELKKKINFDFDRIVDGFKLVAWGFFKKLVIADRVAPVVDQVYNCVNDYNGPALILATVLYSFQIYCDFSGYSDIAIGFSKVLGFKAMENFDSPYFSQDIKQFWNKWHISLSTWLRDYLFLPIAYAIMRRIKTPRLMNIKAETMGYVVGMSVTMFLGGLWHGARWTFVLWGIIHGAYLVCSYTTKKARKKIVKKTGLKSIPGFYQLLKICYTFSLVTFGWIFFRANTIQDSFYIVTHLHVGVLKFFRQLLGKLIFDLNLLPLVKLINSLGIRPYDFFVIVIGVLCLLFIDRANKDGNIREKLKKKPLLFRFLVYYLLVMGILLFAKTDGGNFIYFQF